MSKQSGLGDNFYADVYDLSDFTQALGAIRGGPAALDFTPISSSAMVRLGGLRDAGMDWTSFFADDTDESHDALSPLTRSNRVLSYYRGTAVGSPAASMLAKQPNYDPTRGNDGTFVFAVNGVQTDYPLEWGRQLTAGKRTDTGATNGASIDTTASVDFGWAAFLHVFSFSGTDATVTIQDSADNASFATLSGASFTAISGATSERIQAASTTATVRRYVRVVTTTSGGFSSLVFAVNFCKHEGVAVVY